MRAGLWLHRNVQSILILAAFLLLTGCNLILPAPKIPLVGYLSAGTPESAAQNVATFRQGLRDHGYVEGETIRIEYRYAEGRNERSPALAADLVSQQVDVLVSIATPATLAAMQATETIPIVFVSVGDPVGAGMVCDLAHPCRNLTGLSNPAGVINGKRLQLIKELLEGNGRPLRRVAILRDSSNPSSQGPPSSNENVAAAALGLEIQVVHAQGAEGLPAAFDQMSQGGAEAFIDTGCPMTCTNHRQVVQLAAQHRLPAIYQFRSFTDAGGLISYGSNDQAMFRQAATYVAKILKGAKPAVLPVEAPMVFDVVINKKSADMLGLSIPPSVLQQATEVIQ